MAMPYSHLALAYGAASALPIHDVAQFALGAITPDMRYFTGQPRAQTHIPLTQLDHLAATTDAPPDFVLGYRVHLLIDTVWYETPFPTTFRARFPAPLRHCLSPKLLETVLEYFCLTYCPLRIQLIARENGLTQALGITAAALERAVATMQHYLDKPTLQTGLAIAQGAGLAPPARLDQMRRLATAVEQHWYWRLLVRLLIVPPARRAYADMVQQVFARL